MQNKALGIHHMHDLHIGLMSGTSMNAVDAVLVDFSQPQPKLLATHTQSLPADLRAELLALCQPGENEINRMGMLDVRVGKLFAETTQHLLTKAKIKPAEIKAIGSHGQTIRHQPLAADPFTLQIGDPNVIAEITGITTIADFRRRDMAKGGQGAPLAPAFHNHIFRSNKQNRVVLNLGGIANITWLPAQTELPVIGFDTGPANTLLDAWAFEHLHKTFDNNGEWAAGGKVDASLLEILLTDAYFSRKPPKSTGREHFNLAWLNKNLARLSATVAPQNVQTTLCELTAITIAQAIHSLTTTNYDLLICGGGIHNKYLLQRLESHCKNSKIHSTEEFGVAPDLVEAMTFDWLAQQTLAGKPSNLPSVTGASQQVILGGIYKH